MQNSTKLKYSIKQRIFIESPLNKDAIIQNIMDKYRCDRSSIYRWWNIPIKHPRSIPADALRVIALELNCSMEDLFNEPLESNN